MRKNKSYNYIFIIIIIILLILNVLFIFYNRNFEILELEKFENMKSKNINSITDNNIKILNNTTLQDYKNGFSFHKEIPLVDYSKFNSKFDVSNNNPLLTYACIKSKLSNINENSIEKMVNELKNKFYVNLLEFDTLSTNDIINNINKDLDNTIKISGGSKLKGPIFVLIYQSPYLRFNNEEIYAKYDVTNNLKSSYIQNKDNIEIGTKNLFTKVITIYPYYTYIDNTNSKIIMNDDDSGIKAFKEYFNDSLISRDKLCFMECNKNNTIACGCLNNTPSGDKVGSYKSTCIEKDPNNNYTTTFYANYGMMYYLNPNYKFFSYKFNI